MSDPRTFEKVNISDDEDDVHPNIDTPSLFRMRHRHRIEKKQARQAERQQRRFEIDEIRKQIDKGNLTQVEYEEKMNQIKEHEDALNQLQIEEKKEGIDIDNFVTREVSSKTGFCNNITEDEQKLNSLSKIAFQDDKEPISAEKMIQAVNESKLKSQIKDNIQEEDDNSNESLQFNKLKIYKDYAKKNKKTIQKLFQQKDPLKLKFFLLEHPELVNDAVVSTSLIKMVNFMTEGKESHVQFMVYPITHLKFIVEIISISKKDKKSQIIEYFAKFFQGDPKLIESFEEERKSLLEKTKFLAQSRIEEMQKEELEERKKYLNGAEPLDPNYVINEIPREMAQCFIDRNTDSLVKVLAGMPRNDAERYMDMCVRSGLWVPNANSDENHNDDENDDDDDDEEVKQESLSIKNNNDLNINDESQKQKL